jgi:hypothetical protein
MTPCVTSVTEFSLPASVLYSLVKFMGDMHLVHEIDFFIMIKELVP